jgi:hypothetical protein
MRRKFEILVGSLGIKFLDKLYFNWRINIQGGYAVRALTAYKRGTGSVRRNRRERAGVYTTGVVERLLCAIAHKIIMEFKEKNYGKFGQM